MCYLSRDTIIAEVKYLMMLIVGEGSQISINHKRENSAFSFLIGPKLRLFLEYSVFCKSTVLSKTLNTGLDTDTELVHRGQSYRGGDNVTHSGFDISLTETESHFVTQHCNTDHIEND